MAARCPAMVAGTFQKVKELLVENGFDLAGEELMNCCEEQVLSETESVCPNVWPGFPRRVWRAGTMCTSRKPALSMATFPL